MTTLLAVLLVTLCAGGIGFLSGSQLPQLMSPEAPQAPTIAIAKIDKTSFQVVTLPSIVTNLAGDEGWVRLDAAVLIEGSKALPPELAARLAQDITALLRTLSMRQISGAAGFQHLREELLDRIKARSADHVRDIMIQSLVIE